MREGIRPLNSGAAAKITKRATVPLIIQATMPSPYTKAPKKNGSFAAEYERLDNQGPKAGVALGDLILATLSVKGCRASATRFENQTWRFAVWPRPSELGAYTSVPVA